MKESDLPYGELPWQYRCRTGGDPGAAEAATRLVAHQWLTRCDAHINGYIREYHEFYYKQERQAIDLIAFMGNPSGPS